MEQRVEVPGEGGEEQQFLFFYYPAGLKRGVEEALRAMFEKAGFIVAWKDVRGLSEPLPTIITGKAIYRGLPQIQDFLKKHSAQAH